VRYIGVDFPKELNGTAASGSNVSLVIDTSIGRVIAIVASPVSGSTPLAAILAGLNAEEE
jgi:predicted ABC-type transport system involved in lysophospholipase L1 biosynthesis ATPase subunit